MVKQQVSALERWHDLSEHEAQTALLTLCGSVRWAETLAAQRPYEDAAHLEHRATNLWFLLNEADWLEAFACHPRIGEAAAPSTQAFLAHSTSEQAAAQASMHQQLAAALHAGNLAYEQRFGFVYIVFASNRTAQDLLTILEQRLLRDRGTELHEAARQQHRITAHRMQKWLHA